MRSFDAWHLPGLSLQDLEIVSYEVGDLAIRSPALTPAQLQHVITCISNARLAQRDTDVGSIVHAIDAATKLLAADTQTRDLLAAATGYSSQTIDEVLAHMFRDWSAPSLNRLLREEMPDISAYRSVTGPRLAFHVFSGNVPGVAVTSIIRSLLVRAATLGKTASGEPVLPVQFARALAQVDPALAETIALAYWPGGSVELEEVPLKTADAIIVYGADETVEAISSRTPAGTRLLVHGPKLSLGIVGRDATLAVAAPIAAAVAAYDQQGCVSPHVVYVEKDGQVEPRELARAVAAELAQLAVSLPRRRVSTSEALAIRDARTRAEFREPHAEVFASADTSYTVIYDADAALVTSCLNRTLYIKPVDDARAVSGLLQPHRNVLQSVALAGFSRTRCDEIARELIECGVTRITTFEQLPWPPMWWKHDGRGPLQELLFWHDIDV